jgi:hypothetical protein
LNWGMGHVARCIPLIDLFIKNGNTVILAGDESQITILEQYFPAIDTVLHKGYPFKFGERGNFGLDLLRQFRPLQERLKKEIEETEKLVNEYSIDIIVSDHRYGFLSSNAYSILLTHQLNLPVKWYENWVQNIHHRLIGKFDEIWVPDTIQSDYAGDLSRNTKQFQVNYIGPLSRFSIYDKVPKDEHDVVIVSGPDVYAIPYVKEQLQRATDHTRIIARDEVIRSFPNDPRFYSSNDWKQADQLIMTASKIISRSGYSTLMDLIELKTPFSITPTPGQREQEYLFDWWYKKTLSNTGSSVENDE